MNLDRAAKRIERAVERGELGPEEAQKMLRALKNLGRAVKDGVLTLDEAAEVLDRATRHAGGRPKGVKNRTDALEKALEVLSVRRARMPPEQRARSERRVNRLLSHPWPWRNREARALMLKVGVLRQELRVVVAYRRREERQERRGTGLVKVKGMRRAGKAVLGYRVESEPIVDPEPLEQAVLRLWGQDVTAAVMEEESGDEPVQRRDSRRPWLEPIRITETVAIGKREFLGAGTGVAAHAIPELLEDGSLSWATEATIAECHQAELERDLGECHQPVHGGPYEPDEPDDSNRAHKVPNDGGGPGEPMYRMAGGYAAPRPELKPLARSEGELPTGPHATRWREKPKDAVVRIILDVLNHRMDAGKAQKAIKRAKRWKKPVGFVPLPVKPRLSAVSREILAKVYQAMVLERWRERGCPLPILSPPGGRVDFLPRRQKPLRPAAKPKPRDWEREELERLYRLDVRLGDILPILDPPCGFVPILAQ